MLLMAWCLTLCMTGTTQVTLKHLMHYLIQDKKFFSLNDLNRRISSFNFGFVDAKNKPSKVTFNPSDTLKQSGIIVGDMVPEGDERWVNFLHLLTIMEYAFAPVLTQDKTFYLEIMIDEFLTEFVKLYPGRPLTPKMHYLVHVPFWTSIMVHAVNTQLPLCMYLGVVH